MQAHFDSESDSITEPIAKLLVHLACSGSGAQNDRALEHSQMPALTLKVVQEGGSREEGGLSRRPRLETRRGEDGHGRVKRATGEHGLHEKDRVAAGVVFTQKCDLVQNGGVWVDKLEVALENTLAGMVGEDDTQS